MPPIDLKHFRWMAAALLLAACETPPPGTTTPALPVPEIPTEASADGQGAVAPAPAPSVTPDVAPPAPQATPIAPEPPTTQALLAAFALPSPKHDVLAAPPLRLWATHYYTPRYQAAASGTPLINRRNQPISPPLTDREWCNVALQGSAAISGPDGTTRAYAFMDSRGPEQVNCDRFFPRLARASRVATRRARFTTISHPFGCGVRNWSLAPYRTIAVDSAVVPYQTTLFIPKLVGRTFMVGDAVFSHDGYVFAADRGGAVKGNHIDFFAGNDRRISFNDLFTSDKSGTFNAYRVPASSPASLALITLHDQPCN